MSTKGVFMTSINLIVCCCVIFWISNFRFAGAIKCMVNENNGDAPISQDCGGNQTHCCKIAMCVSIGKEGEAAVDVGPKFNYFCYPNEGDEERGLEGTTNDDVQGNMKMIMSNGMHCCNADECNTVDTDVPEVNCMGLKNEDVGQRGAGMDDYYDYYEDYYNDWGNEERGHNPKIKTKKKSSVKKPPIKENKRQKFKPDITTTKDRALNEERKGKKEGTKTKGNTNTIKVNNGKSLKQKAEAIGGKDKSSKKENVENAQVKQ